MTVPVKLRHSDQIDVRDAELVEISIGGALIETTPALALDEDVVLSLMPPGGIAPMEISARSTYIGEGNRTGVKFIFRDGGGSRRLRELIRRIRNT